MHCIRISKAKTFFGEYNGDMKRISDTPRRALHYSTLIHYSNLRYMKYTHDHILCLCISRAKCFFGESTYDCRMRHVGWPQRVLEYVYD